jgi:hypothetical protein
MEFELTLDPKDVKEFEKLLQKVGSEAEKKAHNFIVDMTLDTQRKVVEKTPVDTGRLQQSIDKSIKQFEGIIFTNVEYAPFVENKHCARHGMVHAMFGRTFKEQAPIFKRKFKAMLEELKKL